MCLMTSPSQLSPSHGGHGVGQSVIREDLLCVAQPPHSRFLWVVSCGSCHSCSKLELGVRESGSQAFTEGSDRGIEFFAVQHFGPFCSGKGREALVSRLSLTEQSPELILSQVYV